MDPQVRKRMVHSILFFPEAEKDSEGGDVEAVRPIKIHGYVNGRINKTLKIRGEDITVNAAIYVDKLGTQLGLPKSDVCQLENFVLKGSIQFYGQLMPILGVHAYPALAPGVELWEVFI